MHGTVFNRHRCRWSGKRLGLLDCRRAVRLQGSVAVAIRGARRVQRGGRHLRRDDGLDWCGQGWRRRRRVGVGETRQDFLVERVRGVLLPPPRSLPALVRMFGIAGRAAGLLHVLLDHRDHGVIGHAALARTVVVHDVTETQPALLHSNVPRKLCDVAGLENRDAGELSLAEPLPLTQHRRFPASVSISTLLRVPGGIKAGLLSRSCKSRRSGRPAVPIATSRAARIRAIPVSAPYCPPNHSSP